MIREWLADLMFLLRSDRKNQRRAFDQVMAEHPDADPTVVARLVGCDGLGNWS